MEFNDPLFTVNGKMATAAQFLKAYQGSFPRVFPEDMEFLDFMEFAEDYADYVCAFEKSLPRRIAWLKDALERSNVEDMRRSWLINKKNCPELAYPMHLVLADSYEKSLKLAESRAKTTYRDSLVDGPKEGTTA